MPESLSKEFFVDLKDWSRRKHQILAKYLSSASKILGSHWSEVVYIDGFAGQGTYGEGASVERGSPLIAADLAREYASANKTYSLRCINIEENAESFANLQAVTAPFGDLVQNFHGTFAAHVQHILPQIQGCAVICFLDPFGLKGINWSAIQPLIDRRDPTDFWIRFDDQTVRRLSGFFDADNTRGQRKWANLEDVYGTTDPTRLYELLDGATSSERLTNARDVYMKRLRMAFRRARGNGYAASYDIRSLASKHKYQMIYATGHYKGFILASDIVYGVEDEYHRSVEAYKIQQKNLQTHQPSLFPVYSEPSREEVVAYEVKALCDMIWRFAAGTTISRVEIYKHTLPSRFGKITNSRITAALKELETEGFIIERIGAVSKDTSTFKFRAV